MLLVGLILIAAGFLSHRYPNLISGFRQMPEEKRVILLALGYSKLFRNYLVGIGAALIVGYLLLFLNGLKEAAIYFQLVVLLGGVVALLIHSQIYIRKIQPSKSSIILTGITILIVLFAIGTILYSAQPNKMEVDGNNRFVISGSYSISLPAADIREVKLLDQMPPVERRTNGLGLGSIRKGHFHSSELGDCRLYLESDNPPFLLIESTGEVPVLLNRKTKEEVELLYNELNRTIARIE